MFLHLKACVRSCRRELLALWLALHHPQTPWYAKAWLACVVAYALSPVDLIPDFVPVLGYLDDLFILPLGIWIALRLVPAPVMDQCRHQASQDIDGHALGWLAAAVIFMLWAAGIFLAAYFLVSLLR